MRKAILILTLMLLFSSYAFAAQFYINTFEGEALGSIPRGWELGFVGAGNGRIVLDPLDPTNKVFAHTDLPANQARHDVGGNIWAVGQLTWKNYIAQYDVYFPEDFYIGVLFRFVSPDEFYLLDRRSAGEAGNFDFWRRGGGAWTRFGTGKFDAQPKQWYRFRLMAIGDNFAAYAKPKDDITPFRNLDPILTGQDATYAAGKIGLYGLILIDNIVIGETEEDISFAAPVESENKLSITWAAIKK